MALAPHSLAGQTALVLGLTGAIGGAIGQALHSRGVHIRALTRRANAQWPTLPFPVEWIVGDAGDRACVMAASAGVNLIVHAVNPPGYAKWREQAIPMLSHAIDAAETSGATILFPANVYVFNEKSPSVVDETTPQMPMTRKGRVRLEMETMLANAAALRGVKVIALRAGDFFGPGVTSSWFAQVVAKGGRSATVVRDLSGRGVGHSWAYVPDLAEAFARLAERAPALAPSTMLHFAGHYDSPGQSLADAVKAEIGRDDIKVKRFVWPLIYFAAPFSSMMREVVEMLWLWRHPLRLDNTRLVSLIGPEPHTPLHEAVAAALGPPPLTTA